uniref:Uncharacterized protein n=1 Tax=Oryza brachyantha TaxID=4533 RepID=J3M9W4_ORYBR
MAPSGRRWNYLPRSVLRRISYHVPCKFDRVRGFSCLFSGADDLSLHRVRVPADLRSARFFGSYDRAGDGSSSPADELPARYLQVQ